VQKTPQPRRGSRWARRTAGRRDGRLAAHRSFRSGRSGPAPGAPSSR